LPTRFGRNQLFAESTAIAENLVQPSQVLQTSLNGSGDRPQTCWDVSR